MKIEPIGIINSPYKNKEECPIQPNYAKNAVGTITIYADYVDGLKDIETFSHLYLFYYFDRAGEVKLARPTFLDDEPHGIFASRHPCRPNGIGMSIVKLKTRENNVLRVEGIDVLDGTPLIDIKPYITRFDCHSEASEGWIASIEWRAKPEGRE